MGKLEGKTAIVTGAGRGLGKQIAIKYAEEGANLAICARSLDRLAETERLCREAGAEVLSFVCDVTKIDQMEAFVAATAEKFGGIDILYNNAMATTCGHKHFEALKSDVYFQETDSFMEWIEQDRIAEARTERAKNILKNHW